MGDPVYIVTKINDYFYKAEDFSYDLLQEKLILFGRSEQFSSPILVVRDLKEAYELGIEQEIKVIVSDGKD